MKSLFETAHAFTALWEGGYVNHPADPGGETNFGVTLNVWRQWCRERGLPLKPMRQLTPADVLPLYETRYWSAVQHLPWPLSGVAYDIAVNHGPGNLRYMLQDVPADAPPVERAARLIQEREQFYRGIVTRRPSQGVFLRGWMRRLEAQRQWLREQARTIETPRVILINQAGQEVPWNGKDRYSGLDLVEVVPQLQLVYPAPGGPWQYESLKVWRRRNGDLVLERA